MSLERKTPLRRTPFERRPAAGKSKRRRDTGPSKATKDLLWARAGGRCEVCGGSLAGMRGFSRHHRLPRRTGGRGPKGPEVNSVANLLLVCGSATTPDGCHQRIESNRTRAHEDGLLLHDNQDPEHTPVMLADPSHPSLWPRLVWLTVDGAYREEPLA